MFMQVMIQAGSSTFLGVVDVLYMLRMLVCLS